MDIFPETALPVGLGGGLLLRLLFLQKISNYKSEIEKSAYNAELLVVNQGKIIKSEI